MQRALAVLVVIALVAGCRMNFDPVEDRGELIGAGSGSAQTSSQSTSITAEPGSDLSYDCRPGQPCMVDCSEAVSCIVDCGEATTCDVLCAPGACIVNRCLAPSCEVDCGLGHTSVVNDTHFCAEQD